MSALKPGLYRATVRGVADVTVIVDKNGMSHHESIGISTHTSVASKEATDARPLIVLDLEYPQIAVRALEMAFRDHTNGDARTIYRAIADQIEAQTKPARIPEPKHVGASVSASQALGLNEAESWTRFSTILLANWINTSGSKRRWTDLRDPTLIREGIS